MSQYSATYDNLAKIDDQVRQAALKAGLSEKEIYDVELAVDEACTNIIDHSYGGEGLGEIDCVCIDIPEGLKIVIHDSGCFFNSNKVPTPNVNLPMAKRSEGGLGLFFMRRLMDEVIFDPCKDSGTMLTMIKRKKTGRS
jgi:serine/threonine-protein kinase RsbW